MVFSFIANKLGGYYSMLLRFEKINSTFLYSFLNRKFQKGTNSYLPYDNTIKGPINFLHDTYGIFISGDAIIGKNCTIYQQVPIGTNMLIDSKGFGSPTIGDDFLIGANAVITTDDIADNCVVVLDKPIIIQKEILNNNTYQYSNEDRGYVKDGSFILEKDPEKLKKLSKLHS